MRDKVVLLLFLFSSSTCAATAQPVTPYAQQVKEFTDSLFSGMHTKNRPVLLAEIMDSSIFYRLRQLLSVDSFTKRITYDGGKTVTTERLVLSPEERKLIDSFYASPENFRWTKGLVNATLISADTVQSLYEGKGDIGNYLGTHYGARTLYTLSKPVFLRNNSLCIFYKETECGMLCGSGTFAIYKREKGQWKWYMVLESWVE